MTRDLEMAGQPLSTFVLGGAALASIATAAWLWLRPSAAPAPPAEASITSGPTEAPPDPAREVAQIVRYLQAVAPALDAAKQACFLATQCGYVNPKASSGEVKTPSSIAPCLAERRPACDAAAASVQSLAPPPRIAKAWDSVIAFQVERLRNEIAVLVEILQVTKIPAKLRTDGESWDGLIDWANAKRLAPAMSYVEADDFAKKTDQWFDAQKAILVELPGVCRATTPCNLRKIMEGSRAYVNAPYVVR